MIIDIYMSKKSKHWNRSYQLNETSFEIMSSNKKNSTEEVEREREHEMKKKVKKEHAYKPSHFQFRSQIDFFFVYYYIRLLLIFFFIPTLPNQIVWIAIGILYYITQMMDGKTVFISFYESLEGVKLFEHRKSMYSE